MRNLKTYLSLLFMGALSLTSCQDDFDDPSLVTPESSWLADTEHYQLMTINEVKTTYWSDDANYYTTIGEASDGRRILVKGTVISSDASGNIYKSLVIQDETGALAMSINANSMNNKYRRGQELVVDVTDITIGKYSGLQQLGAPEDSPTYGAQTTFMPYQLFEQHVQMNGLPNLAHCDTIVTTYNEITGGGAATLQKWQSQLVRFNNCRFENGGTDTFAAYQESKSQNLILEDGNSMVVRTSGYSNFYATTLPEGNGDVVGILSYFNNAWQLLLIDVNGCMNFGNPTIGPGGEDNPYTVDQAISVEAGGGTATSVWTTGYIVGAVAPGVTSVTKNEDIEFTSTPTLDNTLVIAQDASCKDYTKCIVIALPQDSKLRQYGNLVDNPSNYGKQIWLKGNLAMYLDTYGITGNSGRASDFRIDGVDVPADEDGEIPAGEGTEEKPFNVTQIVAMNPSSTTVSPDGGAGIYVKGYIVGSMPTGGSSTVLSGTSFGLTDAAVTNIVIAPTPDCTDYTQCVGVQLPTEANAPGVRSGLNLSDNPGNLGRQVELKGDVMKYCGGPGLKNTSWYKLGEGSGNEPVNPPTPPAGNGDGSESNPFAVSQVIALNPTSTTVSPDGGSGVYVEGYIVGSMPTGGSSTVLSGTVFGLTDAATTNIVIAPTADCTDYNQCIGIQLPTEANAPGVRSGLNLSANPGNLGKHVVLKGDVMKYCGGPGLKNTSWFSLDGSGNETPDPDPTPTPDPTGNTPDFNTMNNGVASGYYNTMTSANGWVATNAQLLQGGDADASPVFTVFGDSSVFAVCLNGNTGKVGTLVSPSISGGIGTLSFDYCQPFADTKCKLTINIKQNGAVVASDTLENNGMTKLQKYEYSHAFNVAGDFVIEILNDSPSALASNKDRVAIWNLTWTAK